ncbi:MAG: DUF1003 domain-containing protein [Sphingomonadaceae bacterium]|nr:DUF1003 domain-containing protein [Sphingomonadaceae bacterium]
MADDATPEMMADLPPAPDPVAGAVAVTPVRDRRERCAVTKKLRPRKELVLLDSLRPELADFIRRDHPKLAEDALVSKAAVNAYRSRYVEALLREEHGEFSELDRQVTESIANQDTIAENVEEEFASERTLGERAADVLARFGGSWSFLITFMLFLTVWMAINIAAGPHAFDAYPFILLNLVLSTIAAIQAPVIMMSQRRQEEKDRMRSVSEYKVNLKAELEIRHLHEKIDHLITRQWQRLAEIQRIQLEIMQDRRRK